MFASFDVVIATVAVDLVVVRVYIVVVGRKRYCTIRRCRCRCRCSLCRSICDGLAFSRLIQCATAYAVKGTATTETRAEITQTKEARRPTQKPWSSHRGGGRAAAAVVDPLRRREPAGGTIKRLGAGV